MVGVGCEWRLDPKTGKWSDGPKLPEGKMNAFTPAACVVDGKANVPSNRLESAGESFIVVDHHVLGDFDDDRSFAVDEQLG